MQRIALVVGAVVVAFCASPAQAETLPLVSGVPTTYTPGQAFSFSLSVPRLPGLESYTIQMSFGTGIEHPPLVAFPSSANGYVFASKAGFEFSFTNPADGNTATLRISDSSTPRTTVPGANDQIAIITVKPDSTMTGSIRLSFVTDFKYDTAGTPPYSSPGEFIIEQEGGPTPEPVPAPASAVLLGIGGVLFAVRSRLARRVA